VRTDATEAGVTAIINTGFSPAFLTAWCYWVEQLDEPERIHLSYLVSGWVALALR